ncbi:DUF1627 domain-containing protein [Enterobacter oligotrophicus]|uniref:DUF1627 domain-containing protein n=1 Tax=Enterobacter oligotrophicus TaxID=2478464 RepID=UPI001C035070|nr:DUF1627 domain-containing protein [Enterobacter oligotrophicus]MBT9425878.1 DUF1627 domain-containing protein [Enterobacter oligotrophicus]
METVLDALKAMGKATYREVAARLAIEPVEALNMLREQREQGLCDFTDGGWFIGTARDQKPARTRPRKDSPLVAEILAAMEGEGAMSTIQIAEKTGRNPRALNASLGAMSKTGHVTRHVDRKNISWSLKVQAADVVSDNTVSVEQPEISPTAAAYDVNETTVPATASPAKTTAELIEDIPAFASRPDDLLIPSARFISSEIRRTKAKLANLQLLQGAVRELRRHKHLLAGLNNE